MSKFNSLTNFEVNLFRLNFPRKYFESQSLFLLLLPLILLSISFYIHYVMVMGYQTEIFRFTNEEARIKILNEEHDLFILNLMGNCFTYLGQVIGTTLSLYTGLLFIGNKISFKKINEMVVKSSLALVLIYLITPALLFLKQDIYTFNALYSLETNYTLTRFTKVFTNSQVKNLLEMFSITQITFVFFLALGLSHLTTWKYKKALMKVVQIYGVAFLIWMCFALLMDLNFS